MTSQQRWYWTFDYFNNKISLLYSLCSCKIRSWSLQFRQFGICQVNTAQSSELVHSCLVNKWAKFGTKILAHFWDIVIFVLGHFFGSPCAFWRSVGKTHLSATQRKGSVIRREQRRKGWECSVPNFHAKLCWDVPTRLSTSTISTVFSFSQVTGIRLQCLLEKLESRETLPFYDWEFHSPAADHCAQLNSVHCTL